MQASELDIDPCDCGSCPEPCGWWLVVDDKGYVYSAPTLEDALRLREESR